MLFLVQAGGREPSGRRPVTGDAGMLDEVGRALTSIEPGGTGRVQTHGEIWTATADEPIHAGDPVRVVGRRRAAADGRVGEPAAPSGHRLSRSPGSSAVQSVEV